MAALALPIILAQLALHNGLHNTNIAVGVIIMWIVKLML